MSTPEISESSSGSPQVMRKCLLLADAVEKSPSANQLLGFSLAPGRALRRLGERLPRNCDATYAALLSCCIHHAGSLRRQAAHGEATRYPICGILRQHGASAGKNVNLSKGGKSERAPRWRTDPQRRGSGGQGQNDIPSRDIIFAGLARAGYRRARPERSRARRPLALEGPGVHPALMPVVRRPLRSRCSLASSAVTGAISLHGRSVSAPIGAVPLGREQVLGIDSASGARTARGGHALGVAGKQAIAGIAPCAPLQAVRILYGPSRHGRY